VDDIAERIRSLGVDAPGSFGCFQDLASIRIPEAKLIVEKCRRNAGAKKKNKKPQKKTVRQFILMANKPTADLPTRRMELHEKNAWMLRSML